MSPPVTKEKSDYSHITIFIYAGLLAALGVLLGFLYLMSYPLQSYSSLAERDEALEARESPGAFPGRSYYIEGPTLRSRSWEAKRQQLIDGSVGTVTCETAEINAWLAAKFRSSAGPDNEQSSGLTLVPDNPNIGIDANGLVYLNLPAKITGYGLDGDYVLSAKVTFSEGAPAGLRVENLQIAGASVPLPGILGSSLVSAIMKAFSGTEEYALIREAWARVESVKASENGLILSLNR